MKFEAVPEADLAVRVSSPRFETSQNTLVKAYVKRCQMYGTEPNAGVLVTLRYQRPSLRPSAKFFCKDMLPLADIILEQKDLTAYITEADFSLARVSPLFSALKGLWRVFQSVGS